MADSRFVDEGRAASDSIKFRSYKKCAIISLGVVVVLAIILTAVLVSVRHSAEEPKEIMEFSYKPDVGTTEDMMSDPNTNTVQYHFENERMEGWIIHDFDRGLQVIKVRMPIGTECYVTPLNRTMAKEPSTMTMPSVKELTNVTMTVMPYELIKLSVRSPILDLGFVSERSRDACTEVPTYWIFPSSENADDMCTHGEERPKRFITLISLGVSIIGVSYTIASYHR